MEARTNSLVSQSDKAGSKKLDSNLISDLFNYSPRQLIFCPAANAIIFCSSFFFSSTSLTFARFNYFHRPALSSLSLVVMKLFRVSLQCGFTLKFYVLSNYLPSLCLPKLSENLQLIQGVHYMFLILLAAFMNNLPQSGVCANTHRHTQYKQGVIRKAEKSFLFRNKTDINV